MYPNKPKECSINSKEDLMFEALEKLPDTYYVFYSFKIVNVIDEKMYESETDFVIFNPKKGILCVEAKAGNVKYEEGKWKYGSDILMSHDGPFHHLTDGAACGSTEDSFNDSVRFRFLFHKTIFFTC